MVGKGAFGKVRIVERKDTGLTFALKYIRKDESRLYHLTSHLSLQTEIADVRDAIVVRSESVRNIIRERRMLEHLNHPFLCNLRYSFQDIEYMYVVCAASCPCSPHGTDIPCRYIVVDLMNGGDLRFHISRKTFTEEAVRFWIAELGCALRYIHKQGIVHRDIKPDNVLLDSEGHVHLADFVRIPERHRKAAEGTDGSRTLHPISHRISPCTAGPALWPISLRRYMKVWAT